MKRVRPSKAFTGRTQVRMPPKLHEAIATIAVRDGVSLNAVFVAAIADAVARGMVVEQSAPVATFPQLMLFDAAAGKGAQ